MTKTLHSSIRRMVSAVAVAAVGTQMAMADVPINSTNFPDAYFRNYLLEQEFGADGVLSNEEIADITSLDIWGSETQNLKGIEYFTALQELTVAGTQISALDLTENHALTSVSCYNNSQLTSLLVKGLDQLTSLSCSSNQLTSLDLTGCTQLTTVYCLDNQLQSLNTEGLQSLYYLACYDNQLTSLNLNGCSSLVDVDAHNNSLTSVSLSGCTALDHLQIQNNRLSTLDLSECSALNSLQVQNNRIDADGMMTLIASLPQRELGNYELAVVDRSDEADEGNTFEQAMVVAAKEKGWLPKFYDGTFWLVYATDDPANIIIDATTFPDEEFRKVITGLDFGADGILTPEEVEQVTGISVYGYAELTSLKGIEYFTNLEDLDCRRCGITSLDLSANTKLRYLYCNDNKLTSLDLSANTQLYYLVCYNNQLQSLKLEGLQELYYLNCSYNQLTSLNLSGCSSLYDVVAYKNQLTTLDLSGCSSLYAVEAHNNSLTSVSLSGCTALDHLQIQNNRLSTLDLSECSALNSLQVQNNRIDADGMMTLIASLPQRELGNYELAVVDRSDEADEGNTFEQAMVVAAKEKGWLPKFYDGTFWLVYATDDPANIIIDATTFPDEEFRKVITGLDFGADGILTPEEVEQVTGISVYGYAELTSLKGIEYFTNLEDLDCRRCGITSLDLSANTKLRYLYCNDNKLTSLDLSANTQLYYLDCYNNQLQSLDLSPLTELESLYCQNNNISSLLAPQSEALHEIHCYNNQLKGEALDAFIESLPQTEYGNLYLVNNDAEQIDGNECALSQADAIRAKGWTPYSYDQQHGEWVEIVEELVRGIAIDDTHFPDEEFRNYLLSSTIGEDGILTPEEIETTTQLQINNRDIQSLQGISLFSELTSLYVGGLTTLTSLDLSGNSKLRWLDASQNTTLTSINVSGCEQLYDISVPGCAITSLDLSGCNALVSVDCSNNQLTALSIAGCTSLEQLTCTNNQLTDIQLADCPQLTRLECGNNQLSDIDLTANVEIRELYVNDNNLTTLNLAGLTNLVRLNCDNNSLTSLDVSVSRELEVLSCQNNQLTGLDVSRNIRLAQLNANDNQLEALNFENNTRLEYAYLHHNRIGQAQMDALIASLPQKSVGSDYKLYILDSETDDNSLTMVQVAAIRDKGWEAYYLDVEGQWQPFDDTTGMNAISITSGKNKSTGIYNLGGQAVGTPSRGFNIIDGRKVILK